MFCKVKSQVKTNIPFQLHKIQEFEYFEFDPNLQVV